MIATTNSLLPFEPIPRAVALTYAEIIKKGSSLRGNTPYANAFCRLLFGKSRPNKSQLSTIRESSSDTVPEIMNKLDRFLSSHGESRYLVCSYFADQAFPSKAVNRETRSGNHIDMLMQRSSNIQAKVNDAQQKQLENKKSEIEKLNRKALSGWLSDNDESLNEFELKACLRHWYSINDDSNWSFHDLYSEMSASRIALDLSFDD
ncbi:plasmid SOS inhibition protein A [Vibrio parahaemolyticus]|nr:plasmid SOS inhibition protein A [Vibrio parahaemolyticus]